MSAITALMHLLTRCARRVGHAAGGALHRLREQRLHETCLHLVAQLARLDDPTSRPAAELVSRLTAPIRPAWDPTDPLEALWRLPARRPQLSFA
jgi:hypothetical protein